MKSKLVLLGLIVSMSFRVGAHADSHGDGSDSQTLSSLGSLLNEYLNASLDVAQERPADRLSSELIGALVDASLPCLAAVVWAVSDDRLGSRQSELSRLKLSIEEMRSECANQKELVHRRLPSLLWTSREDHKQLDSLACAFPKDAVGLHARLYLAALDMEVGDVRAFTATMAQYVKGVECADITDDQRTDLLAEAAFYLAFRRNSALPLDCNGSLSACAKNIVNALARASERVRLNIRGSSRKVSLQLRSAQAFHLLLSPRQELEALDYVCRRYPRQIDGPRLHLAMADLWRKGYRAYRDAARECARAQQAAGEEDCVATEIALAKAQDYYMAERYAGTEKTIREVLNEEPADDIVESALYLQSLAQLRSGKLPESSVTVNALRDRGSAGACSSDALFLDGYIRYLGGSYSQSARAFREFARRYPGCGLASVAGDIAQRIDQASELPGARPQTEHTSHISTAPNILLISLDTVRADHVSCYGYTRKTTPTIDRLARHGVLFSHALSTSSWTMPAHASVFTSLYPSAHGATGTRSQISGACQTLPEVLQNTGYTTFAVVSSPSLNASFGFGRGFDIYDDFTFDLDRKYNLLRRAESSSDAPVAPEMGGFTSSVITDVACSLLDSARKQDRPFLLFVNYFDAHHDYLPPWPYSARCEGDYAGPVDGRVNDSVEKVPLLRKSWDQADVAHLKGLYDGEIAWTDHEVQRLLDALKERRLDANTIVVMFGDHGEEFLEHGEITHGRSLYDEVLHVPLILKGPGIPKAEQRDDLVSLVDVAPTLLTLAGVPVPQHTQGRDVFHSVEPTSILKRSVFAELDLRKHLKAVVHGHWKLILDEQEERIELYDLRDDPAEQKDLADTPTDEAGDLRRALDEFETGNRVLRSSMPASGEDPTDGPRRQETQSRIRAIGYLD